ncbi:MAG: 3-isopropylmalate dehydratase small subunit [Candidatus Bipolaricaulia bacterium]
MSKTKVKQTGRAWVFGDNINTDLITPGRYNLSTNPEELARYCFCEVRPEFPEQVQSGDFVVAGENFGSGSSRETAPLAIQAAGVSAVIARSFARIFYRNAINIGLPLLIAPTDGIEDGDELEVELSQGIIIDRTHEHRIQGQGFSQSLMRIVAAGGIINYLNQYKRLDLTST